MVQCIINIILLYSPHNLLCSAAWPSRACHSVPVVGGVLAEAGTAVPGSTVCSVPASVVDWGSTRHNHGAQADHPRPHSSGARPGGARQL